MSPSTSHNGPDREIVDSDLKVKKTRASKPKVKTGCQTCKIRRVKCDETKPSCLRCVRFGHQCDGYSNKSPSRSASQTSSRTLVPKLPLGDPRSEKSGSTSYQPSPPTQLCIAPKTMLFENQHEYQAFHNFCSRTSHQLASALSSDLWTRLIQQACETLPSIRHAVIEIGTLDLSSPSPWPQSSVGTLRHRFAFRQYNKALRLLRRDVAGGYCDLRTTLIACLLFYCFESYHGGHELAVNQVYSGLKLIREWATSYYKPDENGRLRTRMGSEFPHMVEDDILRAFGSLEIQVMTYADGRTREAHEHYRHCGQASIDEMPSVFGSLEQARTLLELVIRRSMHWLRSTMRLHNCSTLASSPTSSTSCETDDFGPCSLFFDFDPTYEGRLGTLTEYERWDDAFKPLLNSSRSRSAPHSDFILASTLRLNWLAAYLLIASNNSPSTLVNKGRFTTELEELVDISRILLGQPEDTQKGAFVFDMQIIVPLMTVGWIYRHCTLRRDAINLLLRSPRKEGIWDGIVVGKIMEWLAGIEEQALERDEAGVKGDYVPEWAAARCIKMDFDTVRKEARVSCLQPVRAISGVEEVKREVVIPW